jgi:hypothetical protein
MSNNQSCGMKVIRPGAPNVSQITKALTIPTNSELRRPKLHPERRVYEIDIEKKTPKPGAPSASQIAKALAMHK